VPAPLDLPAEFRRTVTGIFGDDGARMLERLPGTLAACAARWSLEVGPRFPDLSINYVAEARLPDGREAVLKVCVPNPEFTTEMEALRLYDGRGAVRLITADPALGALLLERPRPGTPLWEAGDEEAVEAALAVMRRLWRPAPQGHPFPTVARWASGLAKRHALFPDGGCPLPRDLVEVAERLFASLLASEKDPVVLHGDLHHGNILRSERDAYLAIDPKGVAGEPAFEVTAFMLNPDLEEKPEAEVASLLARRLDRFSEALGCDRERLRSWSIARAVLSAWWSVEDHSDWRGAIRTARILAGLSR